jgi:hypothetical protein
MTDLDRQTLGKILKMSLLWGRGLNANQKFHVSVGLHRTCVGEGCHALIVKTTTRQLAT